MGSSVNATAVLVAEGLEKRYANGPSEVSALSKVDLCLEPGILVGICGVSGSGKSTLLKACAGLLVLDSGRVWVGGRDITEMSETGRARTRLHRVGVVFQDDLLVEEFTAAENVALPLELAGIAHKQAIAEAVQALDKFGIGDLGSRYPEEMSGGQRQRIGVARAFVGDRAVLLADEPTASLDTANVMAVFGALRTAADNGVAVVVATHDHRLQPFADITREMLDGRFIA